MSTSEDNKTCERATTTANSPSTISSYSLEKNNFSCLLQSTLNYDEAHSHSLVNIYYQTVENQQSSAKATIEMPIRTAKTKVTKSKPKPNSTEKIATSDNNSMAKAKLSNEPYEMPSKQTARFSRSHTVPIIKIDSAPRERLYDNRAINFGCNKNVASLNHDTMNGANQHQKQEKTLTDEYSKITTSSNTATTAINSTTPIRLRSSSMIIERSDDIASEDDRKNIAHQNQKIQEDLRFGCAHYKRRAMFVTPCCNKFYKCRYCHDENETHHFDRKTLNELICSECNKRQNVQESCVNCGVRFGKYICLICNLFDDEDKKQYHCHACGICRIGGAENFFHCKVCNMCLPIQLKIDGHKCVENISRSHCPVCLGDIHTSRIPCHIPDCGHLLHKMCFDQLLASGHYACPTCQTSLIDMTALWDFLDTQAAQIPMPKKYENQKIQIFCNDCLRTSKTTFHFIGLKCMECGAYNTTHDVKRRISLVSDELNTA